MASPEFQEQLQKAREFRRDQANILFDLRRNGLKTEANDYLQTIRQVDTYIEASKIVRYDRWEKLGERIPEFTQEQWEEVGHVLSGINNGVKAGLFLEIAQNTAPGIYMPIDTVVERFKDIFQGTELLEALSKNKGNIIHQAINYCKKSLCDVGLLAEEYEIDSWGVRKLVGFKVTERGRRIGIPAALSVLWYENKKGESLYPVLGSINSSGETRAPLNRTMIIDYMVRHRYKVREADIATSLGIDNAIIGKNLGCLRNFGIIDYESITSRTGNIQVRYKKVEDKNPSDADYYHTCLRLQNQTVEILKDSTRSISAADIFEKLPHEFKKDRNERNLKAKINGILSYMQLQGYLERPDGYKGTEKYSDASLTPKGRDLYFRLIYPVLLLSSERAPSKDHLSHLQEAKDNLALYTRNSAELYYPHSLSNKIRKSTENRLRVLGIFQDNPDSSFTTQELSGKTGLSVGFIRKYLFNSQISESTEATFYLDEKTQVTARREQIRGVWYFRYKKPESK